MEQTCPTEAYYRLPIPTKVFFMQGACIADGLVPGFYQFNPMILALRRFWTNPIGVGFSCARPLTAICRPMTMLGEERS